MSHQSKFHIFNRAVWTSIVFLVVQQLIVASSTIWITRLIAHIQEGKVFFVFLGLYLASLLLPYFPGSLALIEIAKAKVKASVDYVNVFSNNYRGHILEWSNHASQNSKSSILTGEAPQTISNFLEYIYHLSSSSLNVLINLLAVTLVVEPLFLISYLVGLSLAFLILRLQKKKKRNLALKAQQGRIKWISMLWKAWDNVLLNNLYNFNIWHSKSIKRSERLIKSTVYLQIFSQSVSISMAFALLTPTFFLICYLVIVRASDLQWIAMLVVILPRLFQVLAYSYEMLFVLSDLPMEISQLETINKILKTHPKVSVQKLQNRIQWDKISVNTSLKKPLVSQELLDNLPSQGRITIRGENGSGKSSLLLLLKSREGESAFYLPPKHNLLFRSSKNQLSTGQIARRMLREIIQDLQAPLILLDEWDANLDEENREQLSVLIDRLATKTCVIESRHFIRN